MDYACQDTAPELEFVSGPAPVDGKISNMIWDSGLGRVRAKAQDELDADAQAEADKETAKATAQAALEAVSPSALNQLAQSFTTLLDGELNISADTKAALGDLITQTVGILGYLRDLVVLNMGGEIG